MERLPATDRITVSVIIPAWNAADTIGTCLGALERQTLARTGYEIIVVDNGSTDRTVEIVRGFPGIILLVEAQPGSYVARNRGILRAQGEYLAFTDADCIPAADWLAVGLTTLQREGATIAAGPIEIVGHAPRLLKRYEEIFAFRQVYNIAQGQCVTANWMSPTRVIRDAGGFDPALKSGGDWQLSGRLAKIGRGIVYNPEMIVHHPPRNSVAGIAAKRRRLVGGRWLSRNGNRFVPAARHEASDLVRKVRYLARQTDTTFADRTAILGLLVYFALQSGLEIVRLWFGKAVERS